MPQMDGYELTSTLRANTAYRDIPIVMLTSRSGAKHRQKAFEVGATEYLVKPYQDDTLLNTVRRLVPRAGGVSAA
jgi:chemosensory pili system protein ChpA (sensor histidine kinase/response regulator)